MALSLPRPHRVDVQIAVGSVLAGLAWWGLGLQMQADRLLGGTWALIPLFVLSGLELLRRSRPQFALLVGTLALVADQFTAGNLASVMMFTDIMYAAVVYGTPAAARRIPVTTGLITVAVTLGFLAWFREPEAILIGVITGVVSFGPATTGVLVRNHREAADAARLRAEQTALLAEMDRVQAVTAERARMARELHDMVANHLSAIAIHSTAALSLDDPQTSKDALAVIRENSVEGLAEMRRLIGILRDSSDDREPHGRTHPGRPRRPHRQRPYQWSGRHPRRHPRPGGRQAPRPGRARRVPHRPGVPDQRPQARVPGPGHRGPRPGTPRIHGPRHQPVRRSVGSPRPGSGAGLVGMRERTELLGGTFESGPESSPESSPDGKVWIVYATLPVDPADKEVTE